MRIAYLSRGNSVYDRRFLEKMVERGHQPYFISYYPGEHVRVAGVQIYFYDYFTMHPFNRLVAVQTAWHLRRLLQRIQPDVLHTGWVQDNGLFGALCGFHPVLSMPWGSDILIRPHDSTFAKWITRFTLNRADLITCDSKVVKEKIISISGCSPEKVVIFPWGIDLNTFKPTRSLCQLRGILGWRDKKILIMTRHFMPVYGIEYFIESLPTIIREEPDVRVIFIGGSEAAGESMTTDSTKHANDHQKTSVLLKYTEFFDEGYRSRCRKRIAEMGLGEHVYFAGLVDEGGMAECLNAADIYVSTSLSDGASCSLLEAMACGLPVVVSDTPANFEWVQDGLNGYLVPQRNSTTLAERIIILLRGESLREQMGKRNQQIAQERANWEANFDVLECIYHKLVG